PRRGRVGVAARQGRVGVAGVDLLGAAPGQLDRGRGRAGGELGARPRREQPPAGVGLDAAPLAAAAHAGVGAEDDLGVADLARDAAGAGDEPPGGDRAAADAGAGVDAEQVLRAAPGAEAVLAEGDGADVVGQADRVA